MNQNQAQAVPQVPMQNQSQMPAGLPGAMPISPGPQQPTDPPIPAPAQAAPPAAPAAPTPTATAEQQAAGQVNRLIAQYGGDPYRLSEALGRLRAGYVASQYHIAPGEAEGK